MLKTKINTILLCILFTLFFPLSAGAQYRNPILYADVPDMSVCRAGDYFYMVSTTMHLMPGAPIMRSPDMKHWETISYVFPRIDDGPRYDLLEGTAYGQGQWASSIRYHDGKFYVWFTANGAPDVGLSILRQIRPVPGNFFRVLRISMTVRFCLMMTGGCISFTVRDSLRS